MPLPDPAEICLGLAAFQAVAHLAAGITGQYRPDHAVMRRLSAGLALSGFGVATGAVIAAALGADVHALGFRLDGMGAALLALVMIVGGAVLRFSVNYLEGDPRHAAFLAGLHLTLVTVVAFVLSATLWTFALAWVAMSLALHRLLVFYPDRPGARLAAAKKFGLARLSDAALLSAFGLLYHATGTDDIAGIVARTHGAGADVSVAAAAVLLVVAALLKSAQFPAHGWLVEVMETPTPVSALLHAGVVNAGGVLLLRFAGVLTSNSAAPWLLAAVALVSVAVGSLAMMTQTSVKAALAWSTVAQMGFMLLQCALGAFGAALFHILAHAAYKANAFLSAGTVRDATGTGLGRAAPWRALAAAAVVALGLAGGGYLPAGGLVTFLAGMGVLVQLDLRRPATAIAALAIVGGLAFCGHFAAAGLLSEGAAAASPALAVLAIGSMTLLCGLQVLARAMPQSPPVAALQVHLRNGFYINTWLNRSARP